MTIQNMGTSVSDILSLCDVQVCPGWVSTQMPHPWVLGVLSLQALMIEKGKGASFWDLGGQAELPPCPPQPGVRSWDVDPRVCSLDEQLKVFVSRHSATFSSIVKGEVGFLVRRASA